MDLLLEEPWPILSAGQFLSLFWREEVDIELTDPSVRKSRGVSWDWGYVEGVMTLPAFVLGEL